MDVLELIQQARRRLTTTIDDEVTQMNVQKNQTVVSESSHIFNTLRLIINFEENELFPLLRQLTPTQQSTLLRQKQLNQQLQEMLDSAVMMHVDEPGQQYQTTMLQIGRTVKKSAVYCEQNLYPMAEAYLVESDRKGLTRQLERLKIMPQYAYSN